MLPTKDHSSLLIFLNKPYRAIGLLVLLSFLLYGNSLWNSYALDDAIVLTENTFTQEGLKGIPDIFRYESFRGFFGESQSYVSGGRYRPLALVTFALEVQLIGMKAWFSHLVNILLYAVLCVSLYQFLKELMGDRSSTHLTALITSLFFLAHPVHVEVVANIKGRDELLCFLFIILSMRVSLSDRKMHDIAKGGLVFICSFLAFLSKENAVLLLALLPLSGLLFRQWSFLRYFKELIPLVGSFLLFWWMRSQAVMQFTLEAPMELMNNPFLKLVGGQYVPMDGGEKTILIFHGLWEYFRLLVLPHPLSHDYYPRYFELPTGWTVTSILTMGAIALLVFLAIRYWKKWPVLSYGIMWLGISLSLYSNVVFNVGTHLSERFLFVPSLGYCLALVTLGLYVFQSFKKWQKPLIFLSTCYLLFFSAKTIHRNTAWKDNFTLFSTDIEVSARSAKLNNALGGVLLERAESVGAQSSQGVEYVRRAIPHLQKAIHIHPGYRSPHLLLGNAYCHLEAYDMSIEAYKKVLALDPDYTEVLKNIFICGHRGAKYYGKELNEPEKSIKILKYLEALRPNDPETIRLLGLNYAVSGRVEKAIEYFKKAIDIEPENAYNYYNLGSAYYNSGKKSEGDNMFKKAEALQPGILREKGIK